MLLGCQKSLGLGRDMPILPVVPNRLTYFVPLRQKLYLDLPSLTVYAHVMSRIITKTGKGSFYPSQGAIVWECHLLIHAFTQYTRLLLYHFRRPQCNITMCWEGHDRTSTIAWTTYIYREEMLSPTCNGIFHDDLCIARVIHAPPQTSSCKEVGISMVGQDFQYCLTHL